MATVSAGLVKVNNLTVTGTQTGAIKATNLNFTNLDLSGNLGVGGNLTYSLAALYYIVKQTNLADLIKMFDEFETVIQQTNESYITYAGFKCDYATYSLTKDATSAFTIEFISNLAKQYGADQPKPLYTYGRLKRDECIDLEVAFFDRITAAQVVWENLEGVSEYERSVAERMFLYMKSWLQFSFYAVRETKGTSNYIKGKADFSAVGTFICNMLNIPYDSVYSILLTGITLGMQTMLNLITPVDREGLALGEDLKVFYIHLTELMKHQIDDFIYGLDLGYKIDINDLLGVGPYGGPAFAPLFIFNRPLSFRSNTNLSINYKVNMFTTLPSFFNEIFDKIRAQITRVVETLNPRLLLSGSLFNPAPYNFNTSSPNYIDTFTNNKLYPMDFYPDGTPLATRILSTQIASTLAAFDTIDSNTISFINSYRDKVISSVQSETGTSLRMMKATSLEAPVSLPLDPSGNPIQWMPTTIGSGAGQSDLHNYYKYNKLNMGTLKYNVTQTDSSNNIVLDSKHLFDVSDDDIYGVPGLSVFQIAKSEFTTGPPAFVGTADGLLAYPVGDFTSVGGINTSDTKITSWSKANSTFTVGDASLYSVGTVVLIRNYSAESYQNNGGFIAPQIDVMPAKSAIVNELLLTSNTRYGLDYFKYRVVSKNGNDLTICKNVDTSNVLVKAAFEPTDNIVTPYGNTTWGEYGQYYIRPYSEPILLSSGTGNVLITNAFTSSNSLSNCFLDLTIGSTTVIMSWITMSMIRNVRKHQFGKFFTDTDANSLRGVQTLGYSFDATVGGATGAEFRTKNATGWTHNWNINLNYGFAKAPNGALFGSYAMDEVINGHNVPFALQISRGYNQLDNAVHKSSFYEHFSEWNQKLVKWRAFEMWDPIYAISSINDTSNVVTYNPGVIDEFKRRSTDIRFDVGDPVRICFFDCSGSAHAQSLVEGLGLAYVPGTPTSDYYFVKTIGTNSLTLSATKGGAEIDLSGGSISNAYIVNGRYDLLAGQYAQIWGGHMSSFAATFTGVPYLTDLENYENYRGSTTVFYNWARHNALLQLYGYGAYFSEYYAKTELYPLWGQLHVPPIVWTVDDFEKNVDDRLKEFTQSLNKYNTWDWNLIQVSLNDYKASLEAQL